MRPASLSIIIIFAMIPILAFLSYQQFKNAFSGEPDLSASRTDLPKLDITAGVLEGGKNTSYLDFSDPDGKFKVRYGSSWIKADESTVNNATKTIQSDKEELLLFLYKVNLANLQPSYLAVERIKMGSWEEIMGSIQQDAEAKGQTMEILKSVLAENRISLEIKYAPKTAQNIKTAIPVRQREEILLNGNESYIVSVITTEQNWPLIQQETEEIMGSIEFLGAPLKTAPEAIIDNTEAKTDNAGNNDAFSSPMPESNN